MRPKFAIALFLGAALIIYLSLAVKRQLASSNQMPASNEESVIAVVAPAPTAEPALPPLPAPTIAPVPVKASPPPAVVAAPVISDEERAAKVEADLLRLGAVTGNHDPDSIAVIMASLTNAAPEVRAQAVLAVKQTNDRSLIPVLNDLAAHTEDYQDRYALLDAAEFLGLPTMTEAEQSALPRIYQHAPSPKKPEPPTRPGRSPRAQNPAVPPVN